MSLRSRFRALVHAALGAAVLFPGAASAATAEGGNPTPDTSGGSALAKTSPNGCKETCAPDLRIHKNARHHAKEGSTIRYDILVKNAGTTVVPRADVHVTDPAATDKDLVFYAVRNGDADDLLEPGEEWEYRLADGNKVMLSLNSCKDVENTAYVAPLRGETDLTHNSSTVRTHAHCHPDVEITKSADRAKASPGDTITYTITVKNTGDIDLPLANVHVTDAMLANLAPVAPVPASIAPGASVVWKGTKIVSPADCGKLKNRAFVELDEDVFHQDAPHLMDPSDSPRHGPNRGPDDDHDHADAIVRITCKEHISITKTADKASYLPGETVAYTIRVENDGDLPVRTDRIHVADPSLANLALVGTAPKELAPGAALVYVGTRTVASTDCGPLVNVATLKVDGRPPKKHHDDDKPYGDMPDSHHHGHKGPSKKPDAYGKPPKRAVAYTKHTGKSAKGLTRTKRTQTRPAPTIESTASVTIRVICTTNVTLTKTTDKPTYLPGETITYTVKVTNTGTQPLQFGAISVSDPSLPTMKLVGTPPLTLLPGGSLVYTGARLTTIADCGSVTNTAGVTLAGDANPTDNTATVTVTVAGGACVPTVIVVSSGPPPATPPTTLAVDKRGLERSSIKKPVLYAISVTNTGSAPALAVVIRDRIPNGLAVVKVPKGATVKNGVVIWNVGDLAPGQTATVTVEMKNAGKNPGRRCNVATASGGNAPAVSDEVCTRFLRVAGVSRVPVTG